MKPHAPIYGNAIRGLGIEPHKALFLDDRDANVQGARATGLNAEIFTTWEKFAADGPAQYELPAPKI